MDSSNDDFTGTHFWLKLTTLASNHADFKVRQLVTALNATTTLTELTIIGGRYEIYEPPPSHRHRVVEPLCRCLANLRLQNEHHPLQTVKLRYMYSDIVRPFLVALKQFGIRQVTFQSAEPFPVHFLVDFCRDNSNLKVLELNSITFNDEVVADPIGDSAATTLNLDKLILDHVTFTTSIAATNFAHLLAHLSVSALELGKLLPQVVEVDENVEFNEHSVDDYDCAFNKHILSGNKMPSVDQLTLLIGCESKDFRAVLNAGMATVIQLTVQFMVRVDENDMTERLESLTRMIRGAVKLNSIIFKTYGFYHPSLPRQLLQALEACASVTEIYVNNDGERHDFTEHEEQQLRQITARNCELGEFVANPSTFPIVQLVTLMSQFNNCPTGLYMLTRRLPEVFSFQKGNSLFPLMALNPTRKLRKRRKI